MYYTDYLKRGHKERNLTFNSKKKYERRSFRNGGEFIGQGGSTGDDDAGIKTKMAGLVKKTVSEVEEKLKTIKNVKNKHKNDSAYKVGFMLSLIKKAKDAIKDLYNVAVKHKDNWKALKELKMFELITHTNVDLSHLIRQMVEEHVRHLSPKKAKDKTASSSKPSGKTSAESVEVTTSASGNGSAARLRW